MTNPINDIFGSYWGAKIFETHVKFFLNTNVLIGITMHLSGAHARIELISQYK